MTNPSPSLARRRGALFFLSISQLMVALDATVINIALPRAQADLHFSTANRQWLITSYALAFGGLLLLGGRLGDLWGRRRTLVIGLAGFGVASGVGGGATSFSELVAARAAQGAFGALLAPAALAALSVTFQEPRERATAFSFFGAIGASGAAIGLLLGGALTQWATWRWCLLINVLLAAIAVVGVMATIEPGRDSTGSGLDAVGAVLSSGGLLGLVYGLAHAVTTSWGNEATWWPILAGVVLIVAFMWWQGRSAHPLVPARIVVNRTRAGSLIALFITNIGLFGISLFLAYYLQSTLGYSPLTTGLMFLPLVVAISLSAAMASARLLSVVGPRPLVPVGMVLAMMGMVLFTRLPAVSNYWGSVFPGLVVLGLGLGLIFAPSIASATAGVEPRDAGAASALVTTAQQIGGSMGTALLNTIAVLVAARSARAGAASSLSTLHGYSVAFWWAAAFFGLGAVITFFLLDAGTVDSDLAPRF